MYTKHHLNPNVRFFFRKSPPSQTNFVRFTGLLRTFAMAAMWYSIVALCDFFVVVVKALTVPSFVFFFAFQEGPVCWRRGTTTRGAGVIPNRCSGGGQLQAGLCYPPCPSGTSAAGPVCWNGYGRGVGAAPANNRQRDQVNRGQDEINLIKTKFSPLTDAEATSCETDPLAVTI